MAKKMPGRLVALSASAVAVIYLAGLGSTQPLATSATVASAAPIAMTTLVAATSTYADGTYSGTAPRASAT